MTSEETTRTGCVLRLFGAPLLRVQQAAEALPEEWAVRTQYRSRSGETLLALTTRTPEALEKARQSLQACFAADLYGEGEKGLADAVVQALEEHKKLLVCSDAATGMLLEARLETVPGAEKVFDFGAMSYADAKTNAQIERQAERRAKQADAAGLTLARVQAAQKAVGAEFAVGSAQRTETTLLVLGTQKGCWVRSVPETEAPGLWLLDMIRRAACGLPQAEGTIWQRYRDPVPAPETHTPASEAEKTEPDPPPRRRHHRVRNVVLVLLLLALAALAACWYYTGGDLTALPQQLQQLHADSLPHSGAELL